MLNLIPIDEKGERNFTSLFLRGREVEISEMGEGGTCIYVPNKGGCQTLFLNFSKFRVSTEW